MSTPRAIRQRGLQAHSTGCHTPRNLERWDRSPKGGRTRPSSSFVAGGRIPAKPACNGGAQLRVHRSRRGPTRASLSPSGARRWRRRRRGASPVRLTRSAERIQRKRSAGGRCRERQAMAARCISLERMAPSSRKVPEVAAPGAAACTGELGPVSKDSTSCQAPNAVARGIRARHGKCSWIHRQRVDELDGPDPLAKESLP